jgi:ribose transport system substrate-binding protein
MRSEARQPVRRVAFVAINMISSRSLLVLFLGALSGIALGVFPEVVPGSRSPEITFIPRTTGTDLTEGMHRGADQAAREAGFRLYWNAPTREDDVDRQISLMSSALVNNTRGLILGPTNGPALATKLNEFVARHIPVVVVQTDTPIPAGSYITSVTPDQREVARLAATRILDTLGGGGGQVGVLGFDRTAPETLQRARYFLEYMSSHPEVQVVAQQRGTSLVQEAEQNAGEVLDAFPHLKALFAVSATATAGTMAAIRQRGIGHALVVVGCDDDLFSIRNVRDGSLDSLVITDNERVGHLAAKALLDAIGGHDLPAPWHVEPRLLSRKDLQGNP